MTDIGPILPKSGQYFSVNSKITDYISVNNPTEYSLPDILIDEIPMGESKMPAAIRKLIGLKAEAVINRKANSIVMNIHSVGIEIKITIEAKGKDLIFVNVAKNKENPVAFTGKLTISEDNKNITIKDLQSDKAVTMQIKDNSNVEITNNFLKPQATLVLKPRQR